MTPRFGGFSVVAFVQPPEQFFADGGVEVCVVEKDGLDGEFFFADAQFDVVVQDKTLGVNAKRISAAPSTDGNVQNLCGRNH